MAAENRLFLGQGFGCNVQSCSAAIHDYLPIVWSEEYRAA